MSDFFRRSSGHGNHRFHMLSHQPLAVEFVGKPSWFWGASLFLCKSSLMKNVVTPTCKMGYVWFSLSCYSYSTSVVSIPTSSQFETLYILKFAEPSTPHAPSLGLQREVLRSCRDQDDHEPPELLISFFLGGYVSSRFSCFIAGVYSYGVDIVHLWFTRSGSLIDHRQSTTVSHHSLWQATNMIDNTNIR